MRDSSPWLRSTPHEPPQLYHTWFFRATAISASWFTLLGYTFFAITLTAPRDKLKWGEDVLAALGGIALGSGYIGGIIAFWFSRTLSFKLDNVVLPLLLSSVGGLFELVLNYALHTSIPVSGAYIYVPLSVACVCTFLLAGTALFINTKLKIQKAVDDSRKRQLELSPDPSGFLYNNNSARAPTPSIYAEPPTSAMSASTTPFLAHHNSQQAHNPPPSGSMTTHPAYQAFALPSPSPYSLASMPLPPPLRHMSSTEIRDTELNIPSDEAQRRQLLRLLIAKEQQEAPQSHNNNASNDPTNPCPAPSGASSTYRIDWPGATSSDTDDEADLNSESDNEFTKINKPRDGGGRPTRDGVNLHFPPPPTSTSTTTGRGGLGKNGASEVGSRWSLGNLLGGGGGSAAAGKNLKPDGATVARATTVSDVKMERERRRREIERGSLSLHEGGVSGQGSAGASGSGGGGADERPRWHGTASGQGTMGGEA